MALLLHGGLLGGMGGEAAGVDGSGEGAWTSRLQRRASSLLQGPVSLLTSSISACFVPSYRHAATLPNYLDDWEFRPILQCQIGYRRCRAGRGLVENFGFAADAGYLRHMNPF
eukprot:COSAG02_NODE_1_length_108762_cov_456.708287_68_plen_113_part_00